jgi:putative PIN family toxin of toxin-antitoxin system
MIHAVFDTTTVVSAIFWPRSTARRCWTLIARRKARPCVTAEIEHEYRETCLELQAKLFPERSPLPFLNWIHTKALHCVAAPLGKQRSRDASDDPFLACALAAQATYIVSSDRDLLDLGKRFGVAIVTPIQFIKRIT